MDFSRTKHSKHFGLLLGALLFGFLLIPDPGSASGRRFPNVLIVSVDTLRYDRLSINGYPRPTSPHIDNLLRQGARYEQARTVEPLTAPSMATIFTSLHPHDHGASRNGLLMRPGLPSWPKVLQNRGYKTAAFVGNWTLKHENVGLGEHFETYEAVLNRKRWGVFLGEATAGDLNERSLEWLRNHIEKSGDWPFLLWVHYVEPHAPYRFWPGPASRLGIKSRENKKDRYDTEVAFVDKAIGDLMTEVRMMVPAGDLLVIFVSDHGESLGEHRYWGHGRNLHDPGLHIPMGFTWVGRIKSGKSIGSAASSIDIGPTVLGLVGLPSSSALDGFDWSPQLLRGEPEPESRLTLHQAHKGAVKRAKNTQARRSGLLAVGLARDGEEKEILSVKNDLNSLSLFDLSKDPQELRNLVRGDAGLSEELARWLNEVREGLEASDELPPPSLDEESLEQLRALGYID